jgi:hypothetical protein
MVSKLSLDKQGNDEIGNMFKWIKKSKKNAVIYNKHCNNYASPCCLSCDRCWGGNTKGKNK